MDMMRGYRKNTLVIDFSPLPAKPTVQQVSKFTFEYLKLDATQIRNLQLSMTKSFVYIEMSPEISAEEIVFQYDKKFTVPDADGKQIPIPLYTADGTVEVKVHDLPPYMPNLTVAKHLQPYGEVLSMKNELWHDFFPGIPNGTRIVRMKLTKPIPSYIHVEDEVAFVRYRNQQPTCRHCDRNLHIGQKCSDIKKAISSGSSVNKRLSLAKIVQGVNPQNPEGTPTANLTGTLPEPVPSSSKQQTADINTNPVNTESLVIDVDENVNNAETEEKRAEQDDLPATQMNIDGAETEEIEPLEFLGKRPASPKLDDRPKTIRTSRSSSRSSSKSLSRK